MLVSTYNKKNNITRRYEENFSSYVIHTTAQDSFLNRSIQIS